MILRRATDTDIPELQRIFASAREYMIRTGNPTQWAPDYPSLDLLRTGIAAGHCMILADDEDVPHATFCFIPGDDPTYAEIDGAWPDNEPYATIHRIASDGMLSGVLHHAVEWGRSCARNIRIDTHRDNTPMLTALAREGFIYCGVISCWNGTAREAFQLKL